MPASEAQKLDLTDYRTPTHYSNSTAAPVPASEAASEQTFDSRSATGLLLRAKSAIEQSDAQRWSGLTLDIDRYFAAREVEPRAIYQILDKYIGAWCDVRQQDYNLAQSDKRRTVYAAPAAPLDVEVSVEYPHCRHVAPIKHITRKGDRLSVLVEGLAAPAAPTDARPDGGCIAYQITGWGETDLPEVTFAETLDAAKDAVIAMVYDDPAGGKDQATEESLLHGLDSDNDLPWEVKFEIGGVEVCKVFVRPTSHAAQSVRDALEQAAKIPRQYAMELADGAFGKRWPEEATAICNASTNMADRIRALIQSPRG